MSEATRQLIMQTAERLGYFSMDQIRSLRAEYILPYPTEKKRFILVQTEQSVCYSRMLLEGLHNRFASFGHLIEIRMLPSSIQEADMPRWVEQSGLVYVDGLFIAPSIVPGAWEPVLFQLPVPKILLNFPPPGTRIDSVIWDIYEASYQSVAYLHSIGHRNIMYVGDTDSKRGFILRWQAFQQAMKVFGMDVDPVVHSTGERKDRKLWLDQLQRKLMHYAPSALLCGIDEEVSDVYQLCSQLHIRIPDQLSIVALLNEQPNSLPLFTRPHLSIWETGYRAADRMLWRIANPTLPYEHTRIQGEFIVGRTTAAVLGDA